MSLKILVVDDDFLNRELAETILSSRGYEVLLANSVAAAKQVAQATPPDIALIDINLQHEKQGFEVCKWLKANPPTAHTRVAMTTALDFDEVRVLTAEAGADAFFDRVGGLDALLNLVQSLAPKLG